jgi:serine/threonine protein kinase/class 3 adenylate cyclase
MSPTDFTSRLMVFVFTDLVDSTGLKQRLGDVDYVQFVLQPHNRIFRDLLAQFPSAVERSDTGDGFFVTFESLSEAGRFALLFQHRLKTAHWEREPPQSRIGIHLGDATEFADTGTGGTKTAGQAIDLAARVMGLASGGQILLTRAAFDNARQYLRTHPAAEAPAAGEGGSGLQLAWLAHGHYRLKGKDEPMEVCEVGAVGHAPLRPPADSEKARRIVPPEGEATLGWRPAAGCAIPRRDGWLIVEKLGEGGFGEVWLARHERNKEERRVFKFCFDADRLRSFKRELTLFRLLQKHLGERDDIARLLEVQVDQPPFYLESEYIPTGNLRQWAERQVGQAFQSDDVRHDSKPAADVAQQSERVADSKHVCTPVDGTSVSVPIGLETCPASRGLATVPLATRLDLLSRVARAVAAAHSLGIIHKDLKPSNVFVIERDGQPRPVLADFGIGVLTNLRLLEQHGITETGFTESAVLGNESSRTGTRLYAPPESQVGKPATTAGDVYALGVMLYQFVTGDLMRPLGPGWEEDIADDLLRADILACTHRDPGRRLPSAGDLAERLENLDRRRAEREAVGRAEAAQRSAVEQARRAAILRRVLVVTVVTTVIVSSLSIFSYWHYRAAEKARKAADENFALALKQRELGLAMARDSLLAALDELEQFPNTETARERIARIISDSVSDMQDERLESDALTNMKAIINIVNALLVLEKASPGDSGARQFASAHKLLDEAIVQLETISNRNPTNAEYLRGLSWACNEKGNIFFSNNDFGNALEVYQRGLHHIERAHVIAEDEYAKDQMWSRLHLGDCYALLAEKDDITIDDRKLQRTKAAEWYEQAKKVGTTNLAKPDLEKKKQSRLKNALAATLDRLCDVYHDLCFKEEEMAAAKQVVQVRLALRDDSPSSRWTQLYYAHALVKLGTAYMHKGQPFNASSSFQESRKITQHLYAEDKENPDFASYHAQSLKYVGKAHIQCDALGRRALGVSTVGLLGSPLGQGPLVAASALVPGRTDAFEDALAALDEQRLLLVGLCKSRPSDAFYIQDLIESAIYTGEELLKHDRIKDAEDRFQLGLEKAIEYDARLTKPRFTQEATKLRARIADCQMRLKQH